jgi:nitrous oxidase accessory protein NosD
VANRLATGIGTGVVIEAAAVSTLVIGNDFADNQVHARDAGQATAWDDGRAGNYWSGFNAPDADGDGIFDQPREVAPNGLDGYPLVRVD